MRRITLTCQEAEVGPLPTLCVCCGQASTSSRQKTFRFEPDLHFYWIIVYLVSWVSLAYGAGQLNETFGMIVLFVGFVGWKIVPGRTGFQVGANLPVCSQHDSSWRMRGVEVREMTADTVTIGGLANEFVAAVERQRADESFW